MPAQAIKIIGAGQHKLSAPDALCVGMLLAYFLHFALPALRGGFGEDEMMNLYLYWSTGAFKSIQANLCFWSTFPRPAGALYYLPLYHFFSLNPLPYRIVQVGILAAAIPIFFYLVLLLSGSRAVAFLVALAMCFHGQMATLVFTGSFIYDVLCGFFYFAALTYYICIRQKGLMLRPGQLATFLALYVCALNFKEMAISLPVIVFIYEALKTGPHSLANLTPYHPVYSWHRFTLTNAHFINDLLYQSTSRIGRAVLVAWPVLFLYAFWCRDRLLQLMAFWVVITPLPLAFIPSRGGAMLYIVLFGWATIFARMASELIALAGKMTALSGERATMLSTFGTAAVAVAFAIFTGWENQRFDRTGSLLKSEEKSLHVIQAFHSLALHPEPGSGILLRSEKRFYQNGYYPQFVASLVWNDHSLRIYVDGQQHLLSLYPPAVAIAEYGAAEINYVISFTEFQAKLLRATKPDHA
ncbi:MAG: hypothetical protein DMF00_06985 [Verrucomicrobia bacterium]|nr:MAG: hypothetical protein DMF00_06985 [Verrucomicrobiota bacterium]